jgi:beta-phosphoglucomutase-like phosphatase (HAD superfamily)
MMNKPIIYDCDGVLLDIIGGLRKALWEIDGIKTNGLVPLSYDLKDWMGVDDQAFVIDRIQRFNSGEGEYFSNLEPLPGAVEFVKSMRARGYEDSVLTAAGRDAKIMAGRDANLHRVFGMLVWWNPKSRFSRRCRTHGSSRITSPMPTWVLRPGTTPC